MRRVFSLLDRARLHVYMLVLKLLHLVSIRFLDKGFDSVKLYRAASRHTHVVRRYLMFWRGCCQNRTGKIVTMSMFNGLLPPLILLQSRGC